VSPDPEADERGRLPSVDEVYDRFLRDHLRGAGLGEAFRRAVAKRFRQGPMTLCSRALGTWLNRRLRQAGWTQQQFAERLGVDRSAVAYWIKGGNINLVNLAQVLIETHSQWSDLPLPTRQELAVAAYGAALCYVREQLQPGAGKGMLDRERFWCLFHLFAEPFWERAMRARDPAALAAEAARIGQAVAGTLGRQVAGGVDVALLKQLVHDWGLAWVVSIGQVPRPWVVQ
jgi:transcriptional regulator with XRE-family HTH domain